jgi:methylenetetrahydrofolate dehydrogenase (NADP+)/methenyltetrahydrofolate cyclohydrolase
MGDLVGKPASVWFKKMNGQVSEVDEFTQNPESYTQSADIIIVGVGKPRILKSDMIKEGAVIFDFGYSSVGGRIIGDVDGGVYEKAGLITPVPGGIGPIMIASVLSNLIKLNG